jgi:DNA invertase Pin-like site-specific DNA recombinase
MRRVAIYARYSTKFQKEISVKDQIAYCKQHIERQGDMQHTHTFFDKEKSGGFIATRPGLNSLLEALKDNLFDIVLVENLDRLTRNPGDSHKLFEMIEYHDLELHSVNKGKVNTLLVGFKGTMNALYISDTADKVKRSQAERARQGLFSAGVAYGYRVKTDAVDEKGKRLYGVREIHHEEARIVRRIFDLYIEGWGSKKIASLLNAEGVPSPSGGYWTSGAILGTKSREVRILSNQTYIGKLVYNKTRRKKHPITGKLSFCPRPENERITSDVPNLRIISDDRWQQALARRNRVKSTIFTLKKHTLSGSSKPLTGLIYCGVCGHKALLANHQRYVCGHYRMYRKCKNARSIRAPILLEERKCFLRQELT